MKKIFYLIAFTFLAVVNNRANANENNVAIATKITHNTNIGSFKNLLNVANLKSTNQVIPTTTCCPEFKLKFNALKCEVKECRPQNGSGTTVPDVVYAMCNYSTQRIYVTPGIAGFTYNWVVFGGTINGTLATTLTNTIPYIDVTWGNGTNGSVDVIITSADGSCVKKVKQSFCLVPSPKASFTNNTPDTVCKNQSIIFTSTTTGTYTNLLWNFGDGASQNGGITATHAYSITGVYIVSLTATNIDPHDSTMCGCTNTFYDTITVTNNTGLEILTPDCKKMHCAGDTVTYCSSITSCSSYNWNIHGGGVFVGSSTGSCVKVAWSSLLSSTTIPPSITLTVNPTCVTSCSNTATLPVNILYNGMPILGNNISCINTPQTYSLPTLPGVFYTWSVSPAGASILGPNLNSPNFTVSFPSTGTYTITCFYVDSTRDGMDAVKPHCIGSSTFTVNVRPSYSIVGPITTCEGCANIYTTTAGGASVFNWTTTPGGPNPSGFSGFTQTWPVGAAGTYTITATNTAGAFCNSPQQIQVTVAPKPILTIASSTSIACGGTLVKFWVTSNVTDVNVQWTYPIGTTVVANTGDYLDTIVLSFTGCGPWAVTATQKCKYTCSQTSISTTITSPPAPILFPPPITVLNPCVDEVDTYTVFNCIPGVVYTWSISNTLGTIISGQGTCSIQVKWHGNPGVGNAGTLTVSHCCGTLVKPITVSVPSITSYSASGSLCSGNVVITASPGPVTWSGAGIISSTTTTANINAAGVVCATVAFGSCPTQTTCFTIASCGSGGGGGSVSCGPLDTTFTATPNPTCSEGNVTFTANTSGYAVYYWQFGDGNISYGNPSTIHQYFNNTASPIFFTATLIVYNGTCVDSSHQTIQVDPKPTVAITAMPNPICPNSATTISATISPNGNTMCSSYIFNWMEDGILIGTTTTPTNTYTYNGYGIYSVDVSSAMPACNCKMTSNKILVKQYEQPKVKIIGTSTLCLSGAAFPITVSDYISANVVAGYVYNWSSNAGLSFSPNGTTAASTTLVTATLSGAAFSIYLHVVDSNGCDAFDTLCIYPYLNPIVNISSVGTLCANTNNSLYVNAPSVSNAYSWNNGAIGTSTNTQLAGTYNATATDLLSGCTATSNSIIVSVSPSLALFPIGCDTMCNTQTLTIPLAQSPTLGSYFVQWFDGIKPAGTLFYSGSGSATINLSSLSIGLHHLWAVVNFAGGCNDSSGVFDVYVKNCPPENCSCAGSYWLNKTYTNGGNPQSIICNTDVTIQGCNPITINAAYQCADTACNSNVTAVLKNPSGAVIATYSSTPFTITPTGYVGTYQLVLYGWCGNHICDSCVTYLIFNCPTQDSCACKPGFSFGSGPIITTPTGTGGSGGTAFTETTGTGGNTGVIQCNTTLTTSLICKKLYGFAINYNNPYTSPCIAKDSAVVINTTTGAVLATNANTTIANPLLYTFAVGGNYCVKQYLVVNGKICDSCKICFTVTCPCNCADINFTTNPSVIIGVSKKVAATSVIIPKVISTPCNTSMATQLVCGNSYSFFIGSPATSTGCPITVTAEVGEFGKTPLATQTNVSASNPLVYTFSSGGIFCVTYKMYVNGVLCKTCTMCFSVCCNIISNPIPDIIGTRTICLNNTGAQLRHDSTVISWESSDTTVAKINARTGVVSPISAGTALITAIIKVNPCGWYYIATDIDIVNVATVSPITGASTVCVSSSTTLSNATPNGTWAVIGGRATTTNAGVITGTSAGNTTIKYTVIDNNGCSNAATKDFTVVAIAPVPSIGYAAGNTVNPTTSGVGLTFCSNKTFTLAGTPSGGTWSTTGVASITQAGVVSTGLVAGATTIKYTTAGSCSNSRTIAATVKICASRGAKASGDWQGRGGFTMYPNPTKNSVSFSFEKLVGTGKIVVTNLLGKELKIQPLSMGTNTIDVAALSKGMYFVSVITSEGKKTEKLIVE